MCLKNPSTTYEYLKVRCDCILIAFFIFVIKMGGLNYKLHMKLQVLLAYLAVYNCINVTKTFLIAQSLYLAWKISQIVCITNLYYEKQTTSLQKMVVISL